jgi:hypothetical protein
MVGFQRIPLDAISINIRVFHVQDADKAYVRSLHAMIKPVAQNPVTAAATPNPGWAVGLAVGIGFRSSLATYIVKTVISGRTVSWPDGKIVTEILCRADGRTPALSFFTGAGLSFVAAIFIRRRNTFTRPESSIRLKHLISIQRTSLERTHDRV